jgi:hypothetical protein
MAKAEKGNVLFDMFEAKALGQLLSYPYQK